jgi:hypothetical protein
LLWILLLAKARSGPSRTGIADIRIDLGPASNPGQRKINATVDGARQKGR